MGRTFAVGALKDVRSGRDALCIVSSLTPAALNARTDAMQMRGSRRQNARSRMKGRKTGCAAKRHWCACCRLYMYCRSSVVVLELPANPQVARLRPSLRVLSLAGSSRPALSHVQAPVKSGSRAAALQVEIALQTCKTQRIVLICCHRLTLSRNTAEYFAPPGYSSTAAYPYITPQEHTSGSQPSAPCADTPGRALRCRIAVTWI